MLRRAGENRPPVTRTVTFPAPTKGWVQSGNIVTASPDQAEVLDNFIVTAQGARLRGGSRPYASIGTSIVRLFTYVSGVTEILFASTASGIYNTATGGAFSSGFSSGFSISPTLARAGTNGDWSTVQISTAGGEFLVGVNGVDTGWSFNGSSFSDLSLTGIAEEDVSQVWLFKERLFFVEGGTQSAWYLPVESIGGTATEINLGSVFQKGGNLLFGATWSLDSGSGLDDVCIFVSTRGEIAVYEGTDPNSSSTWALVGVYEIGEPLNKHAFFKAGGDLAILTEDGIIPVSEALRKDRAALQAVAITYPIEDAWKEAIASRNVAYPISATLWQSETILLIGTPATVNSLPVSFAANARAGAWSRVTGWDVRCAAVYDDNLYFGSSDGVVYQADTGGTDAGLAYSAAYVPKFQDDQNMRSAHSAQVVYRAARSANVNLYAHSDYQVDPMEVPLPSTSVSGDVWGTGVWGTFVWGASDPIYTFDEWQFVRADGYSLAPGLTVTSNQTERVDFELLVTRLRMETGYAL